MSPGPAPVDDVIVASREEYLREVYGDALPGDLAKQRHTSVLREAAQHRPEDRRPNRVYGRVHSGVFREREHYLREVELAIRENHLARRGLFQQLQLIHRSRNRERPGSQRGGNLHRVDAESASRARHQHRLAGANARDVPHRAQRDAHRAAEHRGLHQVDPVGQAHEAVLGQADVLRETSIQGVAQALPGVAPVLAPRLAVGAPAAVRG